MNSRDPHRVPKTFATGAGITVAASPAACWLIVFFLLAIERSFAGFVVERRDCCREEIGGLRHLHPAGSRGATDLSPACPVFAGRRGAASPRGSLAEQLFGITPGVEEVWSQAPDRPMA
jgi:hypothetical protein